MRQTQDGVNMVPGAERHEMVNPNKEITQAEHPSPTSSHGGQGVLGNAVIQKNSYDHARSIYEMHSNETGECVHIPL